MRRPSPLTLSLVLFSAALLLHDPLRRGTLGALRFPFRCARTAVEAALLIPSLPGLQQENARLRGELIQRQLELAESREQVRHAGQAERLLASAPESQRGLIASVIARSLLPTQQTVLLDQGKRQGLGADSVIIDAQGVIGRVIDLQPDASLVMLLTDPESRVAGVVERSRETGLLEGRGGGACELVYLEATADIQEGDRIVTAGLGGLFPKGLVLGTVSRVFRDEASGTAWARVAPAARLSRLEEVLCLPPGSSP